MIRNLAIALVAVVLPLGAAAADITPQQALSGMAGSWRGALDYRDYQSDTWFSLPVTKTIRVLDDGVTVMETARFDDGPVTGFVDIYSLSAFEPDGVTLASASFRKGRAMSSDRETVRFAGAPLTAAKWTLVFESQARDDNRPAHVRVTMTCEADTCTTLKEIDFSDDETQTWIQRNRSRLTRVAASSAP